MKTCTTCAHDPVRTNDATNCRDCMTGDTPTNYKPLPVSDERLAEFLTVHASELFATKQDALDWIRRRHSRETRNSRKIL